MQISEHKLDDFIELYQENYGVRLSRKMALERGLRLVRLVELTYSSNQNENENPTWKRKDG